MTRSLMLALLMGAFVLPAMAGDKPDAPAGYTRAGETKSCLSTIRIDHTEIKGKAQIIFHLNGGQTWLADAKGCSLRRGTILSYETYAGQLCDSTIIHLLEPAGSSMMWAGSCAISEFERIEKQTASAN